MNDVPQADIANAVHKILMKSVEVQLMLKDGKIIVAYEKLGGVIKNLSTLGAMLKGVDENTTALSAVDSQ